MAEKRKNKAYAAIEFLDQCATCIDRGDDPVFLYELAADYPDLAVLPQYMIKLYEVTGSVGACNSDAIRLLIDELASDIAKQQIIVDNIYLSLPANLSALFDTAEMYEYRGDDYAGTLKLINGGKETTTLDVRLKDDGYEATVAYHRTP